MISLICPLIFITNLSEESINQHDKKTFEFAKKRCAQIYPDSPCMKKFIKVKKQAYRVVCGQPTRRN